MPKAARPLVERPKIDSRPSSSKRLYDATWRRARLCFLRAHPLCCYCLKTGQLTPATDVDHITPHKGDLTLFWDRTNWQPLCGLCHKRKTGQGL